MTSRSRQRRSSRAAPISFGSAISPISSYQPFHLRRHLSRCLVAIDRRLHHRSIDERTTDSGSFEGRHGQEKAPAGHGSSFPPRLAIYCRDRSRNVSHEATRNRFQAGLSPHKKCVAEPEPQPFGSVVTPYNLTYSMSQAYSSPNVSCFGRAFSIPVRA
jgi:hypothetical protein